MLLGILTNLQRTGHFRLGGSVQLRSWIALPLGALYTLLIVIGTVQLESPESILTKLLMIFFAALLYVICGLFPQEITIKALYALSASHAALLWLFAEIFQLPLLRAVLLPAGLSHIAFSFVAISPRAAWYLSGLSVVIHAMFLLLQVSELPAIPWSVFYDFLIVPLGALFIPLVALVRSNPQSSDAHSEVSFEDTKDQRTLNERIELENSLETPNSRGMFRLVEQWIKTRVESEVSGRILLLGIFVPSCVLGAAYLTKTRGVENIIYFVFLLLFEVSALVWLLRFFKAMAFDRATLIVMSRYAESPSFAPDQGLQLFVWLCKLLCHAPRALIIHGSGRAEIFEGSTIMDAGTEFPSGLALLSRLEGSGMKEGVIPTKLFRQEFLSVFFAWFGFVPRQLLFVRVQSLDPADARSLCAVVPLGHKVHLLGIHRSFQSVVALASLLRLAISEIHHRGGEPRGEMLAADESRLQRTIHKVNNSTQEALAFCDQIEKAALTLENSNEGSSLVGQIGKIQRVLNMLSWNVSDMRILGELSQARISAEREEVECAGVIAEIEECALYLQERSKGTFRFENECAPDATVKVAGREFLVAAMRSLINELTSSDFKLHLLVEERADTIFFQILLHDLDQQPHFDHLKNVARLSDAVFDLVSDSVPWKITIEFAKGRAAQPIKLAPGHWALFVDDNQQVTQFYARVAEALGLRYQSAGGVTEALLLLEAHGRPRLVITDINLGTENGLDLVRSVRKQFGEDLPILVVSGERTSSPPEGGKTKFLLKPVGRRVLFSEISSVLGA